MTSTSTTSTTSTFTSLSIRGKTGHHRPSRESTLQEMHSEHHTHHRKTNYFSSSSSSSSREYWRSFQHMDGESSERRNTANEQYPTIIPSLVSDRNGGNIERRKPQVCTLSYTSQPYELDYRQIDLAERIDEPDY